MSETDDETVMLPLVDFRWLCDHVGGDSNERLSRIRNTVYGVCGARFRDTDIVCALWAGHDDYYGVGTAGAMHRNDDIDPMVAWSGSGDDVA